MTDDVTRPYRLAILDSHTIHYFAPLYRWLSREDDVDLTVYFCRRACAKVYEDEGFGGEPFAWDAALPAGTAFGFRRAMWRS